MKKIFLFALGAFFIAVSCDKHVTLEDSANDDQIVPEVKVETKTFSMVIDPDTKLAIDGTGKTSWEINDEIYIHGEYMNTEGYDLVVTLDGTINTISPDKKTATIQIPVGDGTGGTIKEYVRSGWYTTLYAIYPASAAATRAIHTYYYSEVIPSNNPVMVGCNDNANTFHFKNICGILSFVVADSEDFDSYVFSGNNGETVDYDSYGLRHGMRNSGSFDDLYGGSYEDIVYTSGEHQSINGTVSCDGSTVHKICIPGGANFTKGFTIKFIKGGAITKKLSTKSSVNIEVNDYMPLGDISGYLKDYEAIPALEKDKAVDMSESVSANCYVVNGGDSLNESKVFKFRAVKGNSYVKDSAVGTSVGTVASVDILWETWNNASSVTPNSVISAVDFKDDFVYFKMPAALHAGNAVIAAKDASSNILWSWHIWVPTSAIGTISNADFASNDIMDRNLGALEPAVAEETVVPTTAFGLYYQWGRKDPFITSDWGRSASISFSTYSDWVTTETAVQNPTVFYKKQVDGTYNWNSSEITTLWDDGGKTIYDPCPTGYKVDVYNDAKRFWKYSDTSGWEANTTNGWLKYGTIVFPLAGYTESLSPYKVKERAILWSANYKDKERGYAVYTSPLPSYHSYYKYYGATVRCVAEE